MDKTKIPPGKVAFGKAMFIDREYTGVFTPLILTGHQRLYDEGYKSHIGYVSNPKYLKLFNGIPNFANGDKNLATLGIADHREFVWKGKKPFAAEQKNSFIALYRWNLGAIFEGVESRRPKL